MPYGRKEKRVGNWSAMSIKKLRKHYDESQAAFSRRIGVTPDALQFWEQGRGVPSAPVELLLDRLKEDADSDEIRPHPDAPHTNGHSRPGTERATPSPASPVSPLYG